MENPRQSAPDRKASNAGAALCVREAVLIGFVFLILFLFDSPLLWAQGTPITGTAQLTVLPNPSSAAVGATVQVSLTINLTSVTGRGPSGATVPAVLGGYQVTVSFDKNRLQFVSATGGSSTGFTSAPTFTNPSTANSTGVITLVASQTSSTTPTGAVNVAALSFTTSAPGTATLTPSPVSLSSAFQPGPPPEGPASIPGSGTANSVTITGSGGGPEAPNNLSPPDNAVSVASPVALTWSAANGAMSYQVYFGINTNPPLYGSVTATSQGVATSAGTRYYWRIVAVNSSGSAAGPTWSFTTSGGGPTCDVPSAPQLTAPASANSGQVYNISWTASAGATAYILEESSNPSFTGATTQPLTSLIASFTHTVSQNTTYYYRVHGRNGSTGCNLEGPTSQTASVIIQAPAPPTSPMRIIAVVISAPGQFGSIFKTAVQINNPGTSAISGRFVFHPQGVTGRDTDPALAYSLEPGQTRYFSDMLPALGQSGVGSLDVIATTGAPPVALVRLFNDAGAAGTTGFTEELVSPAEALNTGDRAVLIAPPDPALFRLNIGVRTMGSGASMSVTVRDATGTVLRTLTKTYAANFFQQNAVEDFAEGPVPANASLTITITSGNAIAYGATADNQTQDPSVQVARPVVTPPSPMRIIAAVISAPGQFGSLFKTAVQINNPGTSAISGRFVFHPQGVPGRDTDPALAYSLEPGQTRYFSDMLPALGQSGVGSLDVIATTGAPPVALVRLFNDAGAAGTTGFTEELVSPAEALNTGDRAVLIAPPDPALFRLNIGVRTMGSGASMTVTVRDATGTVLRALTKTYAANFFQQNAVEDFAEGPVPANASLTITITSGNAIAYGATADNQTQDPSVQVARRITQ